MLPGIRAQDGPVEAEPCRLFAPWMQAADRVCTLPESDQDILNQISTCYGEFMTWEHRPRPPTIKTEGFEAPLVAMMKMQVSKVTAGD